VWSADAKEKAAPAVEYPAVPCLQVVPQRATLCFANAVVTIAPILLGVKTAAASIVAGWVASCSPVFDVGL
jgi:hypothetical protein